MKKIRQRLTYANVMSSIAVFLVIGGGAAFAALGKNTVGPKQLKRNAVRTGKIAKEAVKSGKLAKNAVTTNRLRDNVVTSGKIVDGSIVTSKIASDAVTGDKVNESTLGTVPDASKLGGQPPSAFESRVMWATVSASTDEVLTQTGGIEVIAHFSGGYYLHFPQSVAGKAIVATPSSSLGSPGGSSDVKVSACGNAPESVTCVEGPNTTSEVFVATFNGGSQTDVGFYITVLP